MVQDVRGTVGEVCWRAQKSIYREQFVYRFMGPTSNTLRNFRGKVDTRKMSVTGVENRMEDVKKAKKLATQQSMTTVYRGSTSSSPSFSSSTSSTFSRLPLHLPTLLHPRLHLQHHLIKEGENKNWHATYKQIVSKNENNVSWNECYGEIYFEN